MQTQREKRSPMENKWELRSRRSHPTTPLTKLWFPILHHLPFFAVPSITLPDCILPYLILQYCLKFACCAVVIFYTFLRTDALDVPRIDNRLNQSSEAGIVLYQFLNPYSSVRHPSIYLFIRSFIHPGTHPIRVACIYQAIYITLCKQILSAICVGHGLICRVVSVFRESS